MNERAFQGRERRHVLLSEEVGAGARDWRTFQACRPAGGYGGETGFLNGVLAGALQSEALYTLSVLLASPEGLQNCNHQLAVFTVWDNMRCADRGC